MGDGPAAAELIVPSSPSPPVLAWEGMYVRAAVYLSEVLRAVGCVVTRDAKDAAWAPAVRVSLRRQPRSCSPVTG